MLATARSRTRTIQPAANARINWADPISRATALLYDAASRREVSGVAGQPTTNNTTPARIPAGNASQCYLTQTNIEWASEKVLTSDGAGTGDFTFIVYCIPTFSSGDMQHLAVQKNDAGGYPYTQAVLGVDSGTDGVYTAGTVEFFFYSGSPGPSATISSLTGGVPILISGGRKGDSAFVRYGNQYASASGATGIDIANGSRYTAFGSRGNGVTQSFSGKIFYAHALNRAITDNEWAQLLANPWRPFVSQITLVWDALLGAGGGATVTTLNAAPGSYTLNGTAAALLRARLLKAAPAAFTVSGTGATLLHGRVLDAGPGSYSVSGTPAALLHDRVLNAAPGVFSMLGTDATIAFGSVLDAAPGVFSMTGTPAALLHDRVLAAMPGTFTMLGTPATLTSGSGYPDPSQVAAGVVYGPGGSLTGTLAASVQAAYLRRR